MTLEQLWRAVRVIGLIIVVVAIAYFSNKAYLDYICSYCGCGA